MLWHDIIHIILQCAYTVLQCNAIQYIDYKAYNNLEQSIYENESVFFVLERYYRSRWLFHYFTVYLRCFSVMSVFKQINDWLIDWLIDYWSDFAASTAATTPAAVATAKRQCHYVLLSGKLFVEIRFQLVHCLTRRAVLHLNIVTFVKVYCNVFTSFATSV